MQGAFLCNAQSWWQVVEEEVTLEIIENKKNSHSRKHFCCRSLKFNATLCTYGSETYKSLVWKHLQGKLVLQGRISCPGFH